MVNINQNHRLFILIILLFIITSTCVPAVCAMEQHSNTVDATTCQAGATLHKNPCTKLIILNSTALNTNTAFIEYINTEDVQKINKSKETGQINDPKKRHTMSYILPKSTNTDYTFNGQTYRLRYLGLTDSGLPYFSYYCCNGGGVKAMYLSRIPPPTIITAAGNLSKNDFNQTALISVSQADADQMTFDFSDYVEPTWTISEYGFDLNGTPICGNVSSSVTNSSLGYYFKLTVENSPVMLMIDVFIDYTAPDGAITHYDLRTIIEYYEPQSKFEYIYSTDKYKVNNYQVGTYNLINIQETRIY